jgi:RNA polymerase sigma-70 factor, ECF subfamily
MWRVNRRADAAAPFAPGAVGGSGRPADHDLAAALAGAQDGDPDAFRVLYRDTQPRVLRYLQALVGDDAEDVASETWLQVARDLAGFTGDADGFRGWVATIARHRALDHLRYHGRRAPTAPLPADQAEAVLLRVVVGLDAKSAAQVLGKRPGAVRTAAYRGLRALARRLEQPQV